MSNLEADHELGQFREKPEPEDIKRLAINLVNDYQPQAYEKGIQSMSMMIASNEFLQTDV